MCSNYAHIYCCINSEIGPLIRSVAIVKVVLVFVMLVGFDCRLSLVKCLARHCYDGQNSIVETIHICRQLFNQRLRNMCLRRGDICCVDLR